jgi:hypothetical protein
MGKHETALRSIDLDRTAIRVGGRDWYVVSLLAASVLWFVGLTVLVWAMVTGEATGLITAAVFACLGLVAARHDPGGHARGRLSRRRGAHR